MINTESCRYIIDDETTTSTSSSSSIMTDETEDIDEMRRDNRELIKTRSRIIRYIERKKKTYNKEDKIIKKYNGEMPTKYDKNSPFINMLIKRRIYIFDYGPSCHIAAFIPNLELENKFSNWAFGKIAIGENSERIRFGNTKLSTHAEMDALARLKNLIRVKRCKKQKMDLIVIRINKSGDLCESAPCQHCTYELSKLTTISINKLYFSRGDRSITCIKFSDWLKNTNLHISKGWKKLYCCNK